MSRKSWRPRPSGSVRPDVVVRCLGQRILQVMPGEPAPLEVAMPNKTWDQYVLVGSAIRMRALGDKSSDAPGLIGAVLNSSRAVHFVACGNHPDHEVSAPRLRELVELARGARKTRSVDVSDVSQSRG